MFRPLEVGHLKETADLFSKVFGKSYKEDYFFWKYRFNLFGRLYGVQAVNEKGEAVGHVAAIPLKGHWYGKETVFFQFVDAMVHEEHRGKNTLTRMIEVLFDFIKEHHQEFFPYVYPGPVSFKIGTKYGWLTHLESVKDVIIKPRRRSFTFLKLEEPTQELGIITKIWTSLKNYYPIALMRDEEFLKWRYLSHPIFSYKLYVVKKFWKPIGFVVCSFNQEGMPRIIDYLLPPESYKEVLEHISFLFGKPMVAWISSCFLRENLEVLSTPIELCLVNYGLLSNLPPLDAIKKDFFYTMADIDIY